MAEPETITIEKEPVKETEVTVEDIDKKIDPREAQKNIKEDSPRFQDIYRQLKDSERKIEELIKDKGANDSLVKEMREHNKALRESYERSAKATEDMSKATIEAATKSEDIVFEKELSTAHAKLLEQKTEAFGDGNFARVTEIDEKIFDIKAKINEVKNKPVIDKTKDETITTGKLSPEKQKSVDNFKENTKAWYGVDVMMTGAARDMEMSLMANPEWANKPYDEMLGEIKKQVEERFNYKPKGTPITPSANTVESPSNVSGKSGGTVIKLSQEELRIAKEMGVSPEDWAKQKAIIERDNKEANK